MCVVVGVGGASSNSGSLDVCFRRVTRVTGGSLVGRRLWSGVGLCVVVVPVVVLVLVVGGVGFVAFVSLSRLMVVSVGAWTAVVCCRWCDVFWWSWCRCCVAWAWGVVEACGQPRWGA